MADYYSILGVSFHASQHEIKRKYKLLAVRYHPDKNPGSTTAEEKFKQVNAAYQVLSDPEKKSQYDQLLLYALAKAVSPQQTERKVHPRSRAYQGNPHAQKSGRRTVSPLEKRKAKQVYLFSFIAFIGVCIFCWYFYFFMERYTAESWTEKARIAYEEGKYSKASSFLGDAFKKMGNIPETNYLKGLILSYEYGQHKEGYRFLNRAVRFSREEESPVPIRYRFNRGLAAYHLKKYDTARLDFEVVQNAMPNFHHPKVMLAEMYLFEYSEAERAAKLYQNAAVSDTFRHEATVGEAIAQYQLKNHQASQQLLNEALKQKPNDGVVHYYTALNLLESERDTLNGCMTLQKSYELGVREAIVTRAKYCSQDSTWFYTYYGIIE